jgi:hypothetical protein
MPSRSPNRVNDRWTWVSHPGFAGDSTSREGWSYVEEIGELPDLAGFPQQWLDRCADP